MAKFKSPKPKEKRYVFNFLKNKDDPAPAAVVFARFPLTDETFIPLPKINSFGDIDFEKIGKKDDAEIQRFISVFDNYVRGNATRVDYEYFARECFDRFENFYSDEKEIKTVDDFLALDKEMVALIAHDCYKYAQLREEFTMGESEAL